MIMKKILSKIGKVLQAVLAAPFKLPGKAGNILKYIALGLGIVETVLEDDKAPPEKPMDPTSRERVDELENRMDQHDVQQERSDANEME